MIAFAFVTPDGIPSHGGIRPTLPDGAIALPAPFTTADLPRLRWTGAEWVWREVKPDPAPTTEEIAAQAEARLARAKGEATARVNARIDALRRRHYTVIAGQDALYLEKRDEALAYVAQTEIAGEPKDLTDYPLIANELGITGDTPWQIAQIWLHRSDAFRQIGAATERPRQIALNAIATAPDLDAIDAAEADCARALANLPL